MSLKEKVRLIASTSLATETSSTQKKKPHSIRLQQMSHRKNTAGLAANMSLSTAGWTAGQGSRPSPKLGSKADRALCTARSVSKCCNVLCLDLARRLCSEALTQVSQLSAGRCTVTSAAAVHRASGKTERRHRQTGCYQAGRRQDRRHKHTDSRDSAHSPLNVTRTRSVIRSGA